MEVECGTSQSAGMAAGAERACLVQQLKSIEAALSRLPENEGFDAARTPLIEQASELKRKIINTKPLSARLEGCRTALDRARKRQ